MATNKKPTTPYAVGIYKLYNVHRNDSLAKPMEKYMRNKFMFFGIKSPERKLLSAEYFKLTPKPKGEMLHKTLYDLWSQPYRELHYFAIELLSKSKPQWTENDLPLHEHMITNNSWWDSVDFLANHVCGPWFKKYPEYIVSKTGEWNRSENIWLQRMSLLFQLKYKDSINLDLATNYINNLSRSKEFFVQKAIGWLLREYSKSNPEWVSIFISKNQLMPLSKREALKIINSK